MRGECLNPDAWDYKDEDDACAGGCLNPDAWDGRMNMMRAPADVHVWGRDVIMLILLIKRIGVQRRIV